MTDYIYTPRMQQPRKSFAGQRLLSTGLII